MTNEFMISTIIGVGGVGIGVAATIWAQRRLAHRPRLHITLDSRTVIVPQELDLPTDLLRIFIGERRIYNLALLHLTVRLSGYRDVSLPPPNPAQGGRIVTNPFIQFTDFQVLALHTYNNDESQFYVPLARSRGDTRLHINLQRMKAGAEMHVQILGTLFQQRQQFTPDQAGLFPGTVPDIDVTSGGLISAERIRSSNG